MHQLSVNLNYLVTLAVCEPCFLKIRVGANSPSLWPTIFSVTKVGINVLPLWTWKVCPTKSGVMVDFRDHVLIGFFIPLLFKLSIFSRSFHSTNGPFFNDLPIGDSYLFLIFFLCTINRSEGLCLRLVLKPLASCPQGLTG